MRLYAYVVLCFLQYVKVGIVGGSDEVKICEQLGAHGASCA